ncbi:MAG: hypothetical protein ACJ71Q_21790 [Terriglobales bacterium]
MRQAKDPWLCERFRRAGHAEFQNDDPVWNTLKLLAEQTGGPHENVIIEIDSGLLLVMHLKITCAQPHFDLNEMQARLMGREQSHFEVLHQAPADLPYPEEQLIINQRKAIRKGQCFEGVFLAFAISRLPADLKHGQELHLDFSITDHLGNFFSRDFPVLTEKRQRKKTPSTTRDILQGLTINDSEEQVPEINEGAWRSPFVPPEWHSPEGAKGEEK